MRVYAVSSSSVGAVSLLLLATTSVQAGLLDRLKLAKPSSAVDAPLPSPPADPSVTTTVILQDHDAFGGAAAGPGTPAPAPIPTRAAAAAGGSGGDDALASAQTAQPVVAEPPYDGLEYTWKFVRIRPRELKYEGYALLAILAYLGVSLFGKRANKEQAVAWWRAHIDILNDQFSSFLVNVKTASLTRVDPSKYVGHASGRRGTSGLTVTITTTPRNDLAQLAYIAGCKLYDLTWQPEAGTVVLSFDLLPTSSAGKEEDFVFAIVRKNLMMQVKDARWDLSAFASSVTERPSDIGDEFVLFSEGGLLNDWFLKREKVGLRELFVSSDPAAKRALSHLQSLVISDLVDKRPEESVLVKAGAIPKSRKMTITLSLPSTGHQEETRPLLDVALNLLDVLDKGGVPPEVLNKSKKRRAEIYNLLMQESRKEAQEKKLSDARALKKKMEEERKERMSLGERRKLEAKEREKELRKAAVKQQKMK